MLDERVFRLRLEFPLQISFEDADGKKIKSYPLEFLHVSI